MAATWTPGPRARIISETERLIQQRADNMFRQRGLRMAKDASDKQAVLAAQVSMKGRPRLILGALRRIVLLGYAAPPCRLTYESLPDRADEFEGYADGRALARGYCCVRLSNAVL